MNLAYWLKKSPRPSTVMADAQRIEVPRGARAWKDLVATITSLEPSKLTLLDGQGAVIRSVMLDEGEGEGDDKPPAEAESSDLQLFAKLLAEGYRHGMSAQQPIIDSAMQFVERQGKRLAEAEAEIGRLRGHIYKQQLQMAELTSAPAPAGEESIMGSLIAGALQHAGAQAAQAAQQVTPINAAKGSKK